MSVENVCVGLCSPTYGAAETNPEESRYLRQYFSEIDTDMWKSEDYHDYFESAWRSFDSWVRPQAQQDAGFALPAIMRSTLPFKPSPTGFKKVLGVGGWFDVGHQMSIVNNGPQFVNESNFAKITGHKYEYRFQQIKW